MYQVKKYEKLLAPRLFVEVNRYRHLATHFEKRYKSVNHLYKHFKTKYPPGHFYSPYPDLKALKKRKEVLFDRNKKSLVGINIREGAQLQLLELFRPMYKNFPYSRRVKSDQRYKLGHHAFAHTDALFLYCFMRFLQPRNIIEIGSGYSSALMIDINTSSLNKKANLTFIEPFPGLLNSLAFKGDDGNYSLIQKPLHEVDKSIFKKLGPGDILFIDSTHVAKAGGDVNEIYFDILPGLRPGVIIHIHDIFYPFEYPSRWVWETRAWNEVYIVRAFLYNNKGYEILLFNNFLNLHHNRLLKKYFPLTQENDGGSLWIRKV